MIGLVQNEHIGDLEDAGLVHLDRIAHAGHDDDRRLIDMVTDGDVALTGTNRLDDDLVPTSTTENVDDVGQMSVVLADDREAAIEAVLIDLVEVDSKTVTKQRTARDGTHRIEGDHSNLLTSSMHLVGHGSDQCRLAGTR